MEWLEWELNYEKYITSTYLVQDVVSVPISPGIQQINEVLPTILLHQPLKQYLHLSNL